MVVLALVYLVGCPRILLYREMLGVENTVASSRTFVRGAFILTLAAIISKLLGSVYTIILQNLIGDSGMGIYQMAYPVYATLLVISTAGFPVAISKYVSEYTAIRDVGSANRIFRVAFFLLAGTGLMAMVSLYAFSDAFARLAGDMRATWALKAVAPALFVVPMLSSIRGYFQGWQWMKPTAVSQVVEQLVRVLTIIAGVWVVLSFGGKVRAAAAVASFGAVTGGLSGLIVIILQLLKFRKTMHQPRERRHSDVFHLRVSTGTIVRKLIYYSIPVSLGALIIPLFSNVDALTVTNLLKAQGITQNSATHLYGLLSGRAFKLLMLPATLVSSIGVALLPAVSEANTRSGASTVKERVGLGMRYTAYLALPAAVGLILLARPIDIALFRDAQGEQAIMWMGVATLFSSIQLNAAASLQGLGLVYTPLVSLLAGTALKIALNFILVPRYQITGAAIATALSYALAAGWNWWVLKRKIQLRLSYFQHVFKPLMAVFVMGAFVFGIQRQWNFWHLQLPARVDAAGLVLTSILAGILTYVAMLILGGLLSETEVQALPKFGKPLTTLLRKMRFYS